MNTSMKKILAFGIVLAWVGLVLHAFGVIPF